MTRQPAKLRINNIRSRSVMAPINRPVRSASGEIDAAALVLIDIETDEGITGCSYIFAFMESMLKPTVQCIDALAPILIGQELVPLELEATLRKRLTLLDTHGIVGQAIAGIDMALWDAHAKALNVPLAVVHGGKTGPIKAYNSCGLWIKEPDTLADEALELLSEGQYSAVKLRLGRPDFREDLKAVRTVRNQLDDGIHLMCDFNQSLNLNEAIERCSALDNEGLYWFEEPIRHDDYKSCASIKATVKTPVQIGENLLNELELSKAIEADAADFYMPDVQRIGGVSGWLKAAAIAQVHNLDISTHLFPEFSAHLMAVTPTSHWLEYMDWANVILQEPFEVKDGALIIPERAGAGIEWDEEAVKQYLVE